MANATRLFPPGWLHTADDTPADDTELAVLLVNSHDELADPPDRLATIDWYTAALRAAGHPEHAAALRPSDVTALRALRDALRAAFTAATPEAAARALNPLLLTAAAIPVLVPQPGGRARLDVAPGATGVRALAARLPAALAAHIARHGLTRLGSCAAHPCACVYIDKTRARTRRYCCDPCNDRAAAAAYRNRRTTPPQQATRRTQTTPADSAATQHSTPAGPAPEHTLACAKAAADPPAAKHAPSPARAVTR